MDLIDTEKAMLELERSWWKYPGAKDTAIHERLGWTPTRYYQALNALVDRPEALAFDPLTVKRLRRLRDARRAQRLGGLEFCRRPRRRVGVSGGVPGEP